MLSWKETSTKVLVENGWQIVKFAVPVKQITGDIMACAGHHTPEEILSATEGALKNEWLQSLGMTPRKLMQQIGSAYRTVVQEPAFWCNIGISDANRRRRRGIDVAIDDTRFPDPEIKMIRANGGEVWGIRRPDTAPPPVSEAERRIVEAAKARPMNSEYSERISDAFSSAFRATMRDLWVSNHPLEFEDAQCCFAGAFVDDHIIPLMTDHPIEVNLLNHVSEVPIPDSFLTRVIQNDGSLSDYQHRIKVALAALNMRNPRAEPENASPAATSPTP